MKSDDVDAIRSAASWLSVQSISSNTDSNSPVTKSDLVKLRDKVVKALDSIANAVEKE